MVGLDESYIMRSPFSLNNGEKRKVAIASVLISNPKLLIMDEPTIGLDNNSKKFDMNKQLNDTSAKIMTLSTTSDEDKGAYSITDVENYTITL